MWRHAVSRAAGGAPLGGVVHSRRLCSLRSAMISLAGVRRALYTKRKQLQQAKLEEEGEQPAPEPLSLPADVLVACLCNLTEVGARGTKQRSGAVTGALAPRP